MDDLSLQELLALKRIHLTGQMSDKTLASKFVEKEMIANTESSGMLLTNKGRAFLVRGSPALWDVTA